MKIAYQSQQLKRLINEYPNKLDRASLKAMRQSAKFIAKSIQKETQQLPTAIPAIRVSHYSNKDSATVFVGLNKTPFRYFDGTGMQLPIQKTFRPTSGVSLLDKTVAGSFVGKGKDSGKLMVFIRNGGRMRGKNKESIEQVKMPVDEYFDGAIRANEIKAADIFASLSAKYLSEVEP